VTLPDPGPSAARRGPAPAGECVVALERGARSRSRWTVAIGDLAVALEAVSAPPLPSPRWDVSAGAAAFAGDLLEASLVAELARRFDLDVRVDGGPAEAGEARPAAALSLPLASLETDLAVGGVPAGGMRRLGDDTYLFPGGAVAGAAAPLRVASGGPTPGVDRVESWLFRLAQVALWACDPALRVTLLPLYAPRPFFATYEAAFELGHRAIARLERGRAGA